MAAAGTVLGGRYLLIDVLGDGGMARVFRAEDERLGRTVAVKILHQQYLGQAEFVRRFEQEARLAAGLTHPNVVAIYDVGRDDDTYFIVMEYVEGRSLKALIANEAPIPLDRATAIMRQLGLALDVAHAHGIVHRDIKPENILLTPDGQVKVSDFGIARAMTSPGQTATGMVLGSVSYFSPEQAQGQPATAESDLYSSGIVLYEMLTGQLPFVADNPLATAMQHITQPPAPPRAFVPTLPGAVDAVVLKALAKTPEARFHSGAVLAEALASARGSGPLSAHTASAQPPGTAPPPHDAQAGRSIPQVHAARTIRMSRTAPAPSRRRLAPLPVIVVAALGGGAVYAAMHGFQINHAAPNAAAAPTRTPRPAATQAAVAPTQQATSAPTTAPSATSVPTTGATATPRTAAPTPSPHASSGGKTGNVTAAIVTARGLSTDANGVPAPVDPRDSFALRWGQSYAILHFQQLPPHARVAARWTFPGGRSADIALPGGFSTVWSEESFAGPGKYTISAVVNGKVIASHSFIVKEGGHAAGQTPPPGSGTQGTVPAGQPVTQADAFAAARANKGNHGHGHGHGRGNGNNQGNSGD